jgi:hypothetical protein
MTVELWQVPVLVMAGIVLLEIVVRATARRWITSTGRLRLRTAAFILLAIGVSVGGVVTLGPDLADKLSSVAALVVGAIALWRPGQRPGDARAVEPPAAEEAEKRRHDRPAEAASPPSHPAGGPD